MVKVNLTHVNRNQHTGQSSEEFDGGKYGQNDEKTRQDEVVGGWSSGARPSSEVSPSNQPKQKKCDCENLQAETCSEAQRNSGC